MLQLSVLSILRIASVKKVQNDSELQKEIAGVLQAEDPEDTAKADQWLVDNGYEFTLRELVAHLEDGIPLSDEQLEAVAGGKSKEVEQTVSVAESLFGALVVGLGVLKCKKVI